MGFSYCVSCNLRGHSDEFYEACCAVNYNGEGGMCDKCARCIDREICGECSLQFCEDHGGFNKHTCCGLILCGDTGEETGCLSEHHTEKLECGHEGCAYYKDGLECRICVMQTDEEKEIAAMLKDHKHVVSLSKIVKSKELSAYLSKWLARLPEDPNRKRKAGVPLEPSTSKKKEVIVIDD